MVLRTQEAAYAAIGLVTALVLFLASGPGLLGLQIIRFCSRGLVYFTQSGLQTFFFGTEGDTRIYRDPLMDIIAENPVDSMKFVRLIMGLSCVFTAAWSIPTVAYLASFWQASGSCDKPLRYWLVVMASMSLFQFPLRIIFSYRLKHLAAQRADVMAVGFHYLTSSRAWCLSKAVSLASYAWFVLGAFWTFTTTSCPDAPCLIYGSVGVITACLMRLFLTMGLFYYFFPAFFPTANAAGQGAGRAGIHGIHRRQPMSKKRIDSLGTLSLLEAIQRAGRSPSCRQELCSICLADFDESDRVRCLPQCKHFFHTGCIDRWLRNCCTCPLCLQAIEE